ncbi:Na+/H+ antiporter NhaA [Thaumasiovibrio sp. DFM-14]|uniref:Na+/H+ antiporter NhaA n=1 Tax=Thaumasiovibrio sp. DFM-14 TaxID=3384792 RepID=UPI0039A2EB24
MSETLRKFLKMESAGGIVLIVAAIAAMFVANSALGEGYRHILHTYVLGLSIEHWINDGLMAVFFLLIGLEVKRELIEGALNSKEKAIFPAIAALGGMLAPAAIYTFFNYGDPVTVEGWAIPAATDIAFALGVMGLLGKRVPVSLKVFLLALAIIDDLGVIIIIALFYSSDLSIIALSIAFTATGLLFVLSARNVTQLRWYLLVGFILWASVLQSGVHATLAGVVLGFAIPIEGKPGGVSPLKLLENKLHYGVAFLILPLFAFANAGILLQGVSVEGLFSTLPLGIALGLFVGKPLGIFVFSWVAVRSNLAHLPEGIDFKQIFAVSVLCGIGFTMSMFISSLAFSGLSAELITYSRLGILIGSCMAALAGYVLLVRTLPRTREAVVTS